MNGDTALDSRPANDFIEQYCAVTDEADPLAMALTLMRNPSLKMHGPEHHFLVSAVLITAWCIERENRDRTPLLLAEARFRAEDTRGDFCGKHGGCGAAMGAGIAYSIITGSSPLSAQEWRLANLMAATCLTAVAETGGPRCCKRDAFLSIMTAVEFLNLLDWSPFNCLAVGLDASVFIWSGHTSKVSRLLTLEDPDNVCSLAWS